MKGAMTIMKKDLRGFFGSPTFFVVAFLCSAIFSWVYPISLNMFIEQSKNAMMQMQMNSQTLNIHYGVFLRHLSYLNLMLIFVVPALSMRLLAEEKKMRTFDLLLTSPVTSFEIVFGKYLAVLGAILGIFAVAFVYPLATAMFAKLNWAPLLVAFFGVFLVGSVYAAMNLFASAITDSVLLAYVIAVILNISVWFVGIGAEVTDSALVRQVFEHISLNAHLGSLVEGTIRTNGLVFLASVIFLFCFLAERVVESSRWR